MDTEVITRSIGEIRALAEAGNIKAAERFEQIDKRLLASDSILLDLQQKVLVKGTSLASDGPGRLGLDLGALVARDPRIPDLLSGAVRQIAIALPYPTTTINKSILTNSGAGAAGTIAYPTPPQELPGGPRGFTQRRLALWEILPRVTVSGAESVVPRLISITGDAAQQLLESDVKASVDYVFGTTTYRHKTVAVTTQVSSQTLSDNGPMLATFINSTSLFLVSRKAESIAVVDILAGGLPFASPATAGADVIAECLVTMEAGGYAPSILLLSPEDYLRIFLERASTSGLYLGGGWSTSAPGSLWGLRAIVTSALPAGTGLLLDPQCISLLDREAAQILIGQPGDSFQRNIYMVLAELRASVAILDQAGVSILTLPSGA